MFWLSQVSLVAIYVVLVCSYDVVAGRAGLLSMAHAALFGTGAYAAALVMLHTDITDIFVLMAIGGAAAAILSIPIAALSLRVREEYFTVTSLGFAVAFIAALNNIGFFGLSEGLVGIPPATLGSIQLVAPVTVAIFTGVVALFVLAATLWLVRSRWGLKLEAVRDSENGAVSFGINPVAMRISAVAISGVGAGIAGVLYVLYAEFISPETFDLPTLALIVAMLGLGHTVGKIGYIFGPVLLVGVSAALEYLHIVSLTILGPLDQIIYGLVMVFAVMLVPRRLQRQVAQ